MDVRYILWLLDNMVIYCAALKSRLYFLCSYGIRVWFVSLIASTYWRRHWSMSIFYTAYQTAELNCTTRCHSVPLNLCNLFYCDNVLWGWSCASSEQTQETPSSLMLHSPECNWFVSLWSLSDKNSLCESDTKSG